MADGFAIRATSQALQSVTRNELSLLEVPRNNIVIESIDLLEDSAPKPRITIFLFNIRENPGRTSHEWSLLNNARRRALHGIAEEFSALIRRRNAQARYRADKMAFLDNDDEVTVGRPVEGVGRIVLLEEAAASGVTVLHDLHLRFRGGRGQMIGAPKAQLDFLLISDKEVKEIVSAKIQPGTAKPAIDRAHLSHYINAPLTSDRLPAYLFQHFATNNSDVNATYRDAIDVDVVVAGGVPETPLAIFRSTYLVGTKTPVRQIVVRELSPSTGAAPNPGRVALPVTRDQLLRLLSQEIDRIL